jgi:hypothetical protein
MKYLLLIFFFVATPARSQSLTLASFKALLTQKQTTLEKINPGMSKKLITTSKIPTELGPCELTETAIQTVLKILGDKIIVHSNESYIPAATPACAGFEAQSLAIIFYAEKPTLASDLATLDESAQLIKSITRTGEKVSLNLLAQNGEVRVTYDLSRPSFKNTILIQDEKSKMIGEDMPDLDVHSIDLKKVLFCESDESEQCAEGDWSDILF